MDKVTKEKYLEAIKKRTELEHKGQLTREQFDEYGECCDLIEQYEIDNNPTFSFGDIDMEDDEVFPDFVVDFDDSNWDDGDDTDLYDLMDDQNDYPQYSDWGI
jgi:hypothetical protein